MSTKYILDPSGNIIPVVNGVVKKSKPNIRIDVQSSDPLQSEIVEITQNFDFAFLNARDKLPLNCFSKSK